MAKVNNKKKQQLIYVEDPETMNQNDVLASINKQPEPINSLSWDVYKENIQPLSQGRKIDALWQTLPLVDSNKTRLQLFETRKEEFDRDLLAKSDNADQQLDLWCEYIDWLEQNVPDGGKVNGITNAIEQCIELYYDKKEFKQDKRLFEIFMKFKRFCEEPIEIFGFMYANSICTLLARFYLNWSWQYEIRRNMKRAEDLLKLGLRNLASPREVLEEAHEQLKCRIARMIRSGELADCPQDSTAASVQLSTRQTQAELVSSGIRAALQTLKFKVTKKKSGIGADATTTTSTVVPINRIGSAVDQTNIGGLKSQTKVVNGIRVPNNQRPKARGTLKPSNKPVFVFNENDENGQTGNVVSAGSGSSSSDQPGDENAAASASLAHLTSTKVPTLQRINVVGKSGSENQLPRYGSISAAALSNNNNTLTRGP